MRRGMKSRECVCRWRCWVLSRCCLAFSVFTAARVYTKKHQKHYLEITHGHISLSRCPRLFSRPPARVCVKLSCTVYTSCQS